MASCRAIKFSTKLKELRIHLCQNSDPSKGVRKFIEQYYVPLKKENPEFSILVRECSGVKPLLWARYEKVFNVHSKAQFSMRMCIEDDAISGTEELLRKEFGEEKRIPLDNLTADQVLDKVKSASS